LWSASARGRNARDVAGQDAVAPGRTYDRSGSKPDEEASDMRIRHAVVLGCLAIASSGAWAGQASFAECIEGSDFIANAAGSRDNGMSREAFLDRLEGDFVAIRAYPVALRWFVKDAADERFLADAVRDVYDRPAPPDEHRVRFLAACLARGQA
jgi:hypothetical protein